MLLFDLAAFYNTNLFIINLNVYFQKKLQENLLVSSVKIIIKYISEKKDEINEEILENIKENKNKDFILIQGLKIRNF